MTFEQFAQIRNDFYKHTSWRHGLALLTVEQEWDQVCEFVRDYWPSDVIFDDANLQKIIDSCLWRTALLTSSELSVSARETRENLRHHVPPSPAPALPPEPTPMEKTRDSLGDGAASTESGIPHHSNTPTESTALQRGRDYAWNRFNYDNQLEALRAKAFAETPLVNGLRNKAEVDRRYAELKAELDKSMLPSKDDANYLQEVADRAYAEAQAAGCSTVTEVLKRVNAAIDAARRKS